MARFLHPDTHTHTQSHAHIHTGAHTHTHAQLLLVCQGHVARPSLSAVWLPSGPCAGLLCVTFRQSRSDITCSQTGCLLSGIWWDHLLRVRNHAKLVSTQWLLPFPLKECQENVTLFKCLRFNLSDLLSWTQTKQPCCIVAYWKETFLVFFHFLKCKIVTARVFVFISSSERHQQSLLSSLVFLTVLIHPVFLLPVPVNSPQERQPPGAPQGCDVVEGIWYSRVSSQKYEPCTACIENKINRVTWQLRNTKAVTLNVPNV